MIVQAHQSIDLEEALHLSTRALCLRIAEVTGYKLGRWHVRHLLLQAQDRGYLVLPVCGKVDTRGFCTGHQIPSLAEEETDAEA